MYAVINVVLPLFALIGAEYYPAPPAHSRPFALPQPTCRVARYRRRMGGDRAAFAAAYRSFVDAAWRHRELMCANAIGLFLQRNRERIDLARVGRIVILTLFAMPLLTLALGWLMPIPRIWLEVPLLLVALPTGVGLFVLANLHGRPQGVTS